MSSTPSPTVENLKIAFAGESQANRKYLAFARKAEQEGFPVIAKLFRAAAEAETVHALGHFQNMGGVQSTLENLKTAVAGETYEFTEMYPPMLEQAQRENHPGKVMIGFATKAERVHANLFQTALDRLASGSDLETMEIWYCPVCGHIEYAREAPAKCPICGAPSTKFVKMV
ncbi:rubrerythrin family protein [Pelomyxa schiedti]|nr:rubrerythrin family protein [Pelomyxa schiedti]